MEQPSDSRIRFGASSLEDGQTFTTTIQDRDNVTLPPPPPTPSGPQSVNIEEFMGLQQEVKHMRSALDTITHLLQQQLQSQAVGAGQEHGQTRHMSRATVDNRPLDNSPDLDRWLGGDPGMKHKQQDNAPSRRSPSLEEGHRHKTRFTTSSPVRRVGEPSPQGINRRAPAHAHGQSAPNRQSQAARDQELPDLDVWMDHMLHGDLRKEVPMHKHKAMEREEVNKERFGRGLQNQHSPHHTAFPSSPAYHDLPDIPHTSAFKPKLASTNLIDFEDNAREPNAQKLFRPRPGALQPPAAAKAEGSRRIVTPERYHGTSPLQEYLVHFELCAELNGWDDYEKAKFLGVSLRGAAQCLLVHGRSAYSYQEMVDALQERFGLEGQTEIFLAELQTKVKGTNESYRELADNISRLVAKAYPTASYDTRSVLSVQAFIKSLTNTELRMRIKLMKPHTIREAVLAAIEYEAIERAERSTAPPKQERVRKVSEKPGEKKAKAPKSPQPMVQQVSPQANLAQEIRDMIKAELAGIKSSTNDSKPVRPRRPIEEITCYRCKRKGHYASSCRADNSIVEENERNRAQRQRSRPSSPSATGNA